MTLLIDLESSGENYLCDFTFDFFWQHLGSRLDPDQTVGGSSRRKLVEALKRGETVHIRGDAGSALGSSLGVDLVKLGGKGGALPNVGSIIVDGNVGKRMGISMLRGAVYLGGLAEEPLGNVIEAETDRTGYRKFISITEVLEKNIQVLEPNILKGSGLSINDGLYRDTVGARNPTEKIIRINGSAGMSTGILMRSGHIEVFGNADRNTGVLMSGGRIVVRGQTGDFTGAEMRGGEIFVAGNAGCFACAKISGGAVYARSCKAVPPAREHPLKQNELATLTRVLELNPIHAMMYKRWGL
jgi:formylmethanofuran dehydrogenase subunit C